MPQKFFDILPPSKSARSKSGESKAVKEIKPVFEDEKTLPQASEFEEVRPLERKVAAPKVKRMPKKTLLRAFALVLFVLVLGGVLALLRLSKTEIGIWPKMESLALEGEFTVDVSRQKADLAAKAFPGRALAEEKSTSQEFPATGKAIREDKATGVIQIYNAYSGLPQVLAVSTRFVSADGKVFKTLRKVTVPGATYDKGKLVPSSVSVEIQAAQAGEEYNINPSTFSIPGFAGTPKYTAFYGKTFSATTGGFKGESKQVTQNDLDNARAVLAGKIRGESKDNLRAQNETDFVLLDDALSQETIESISSQKAGAIADSFTYQVKVKSSWISFRKDEVKNFVEKTINLEKKLLEESLSVSYLLKTVDKETGVMVVNLNVRAQIYSDPKVDEIKGELLGRPLKEVNSFLGGYPEIEKVKVKSPFWRVRIPTDSQRVIIKVNIEPAVSQ